MSIFGSYFIIYKRKNVKLDTLYETIIREPVYDIHTKAMKAGYTKEDIVALIKNKIGHDVPKKYEINFFKC